jgi:hypothetical protein
MSFWDVVWFICISFLFVAYLMVLFTILGDLFRDKQMSGWGKAAWVVALIIFPLITSLIYLVARGRNMGDRQAEAASAMQAQQEAYIKQVAGKASPADQIAQAKAMLEAGVITQAEYDRLKEKALV